MSREDRAVRAAFVLALGLFLGALPWPERAAPDCPRPREAVGDASGTREVRCDGVGPPLRGAARLLFGLRLDPNRAPAGSLEGLPGIGPARAAAIVAERERRPFERVSDLRRVRGIGPVTLAGIEPWLEIRREPAPEARLPQNR